MTNIVPYLVKGIKESDSEVLRMNASEVLHRIDRCAALKVLAQEAEGVIPYEQKERLEVAAKYINDRNSSAPPCKDKPIQQ